MTDRFEQIKKRPFYTKFALAYDILTDKSVAEICRFMNSIFIEQGMKQGSTILDAGCGTGNYSIDLAQRGYSVTGVDISEEQIEQAQLKAFGKKLPVKFIVENFIDYQFPQKYDAVICRGVLNDFIDDQTRRQAFESFCKNLNKQGLLIFDVRDWKNSKAQKIKNPITEKTVTIDSGSLYFKSETKLDESSHSLIIKETHIQTKNGKEEKHEFDFSMRCWEIDEIIEYLNQAGYEILYKLGGYDKNTALGTTERIVIVASCKKKSLISKALHIQ